MFLTTHLLININRYQTGETIVRVASRPTSDAVDDVEMPFIELTICASYDDAYNDDILNQYGMNKGKYRRSGHYTPTNNYTGDMNLREVFNSISYDVEEMLYQVRFVTNSPLSNTRQSVFRVDFRKDLANVTKNANIHTVYWANFGRCYSLRPKDHVLKETIISVLIWSRMSIYVYFGYPGQFMYKTKSKVLIL